jgi:hypothetical protein
MVTDPFDPAAWLARWKAAGGGWVNSTLLLLNGDPDALNALAGELTNERYAALHDHLTSWEPAE